MKKVITASLMMALGVAGAQAGGGYVDNTQYVAPAPTYTAPVATPAVAAPVAGSSVLTDVPAGHWAREAVEHIVKRGLIQGFPDGTFRGNQNLTRYQAAMIFHRLLQSGALSDAGISDADMLTITRGMQEVSEELAAVSSRLTDVERLTVEQEARIAALENAIASIDTGDNSALIARLAALEGVVAGIDTGDNSVLVARLDDLEGVVAGMDTNTWDDSALVARIDGLEARIADLQNRPVQPAPAQPAPAQPAPAQPAPAQPAPVESVPVESVTPEVVVPEVVVPDIVVTPTVPQVSTSTTYFGIGGSYYPTKKEYIAQATNTSNNAQRCLDPIKTATSVFSKKDKPHDEHVNYCTGVFATVGSDNIMDLGGLGLGARANVEFYPSTANAVSGDINAMTNFDLGLIQPYAGAGVGVVYGPNEIKSDAESYSDIYGNLLLGTDFQIAQNIGLFAEANGRYYFSNKTEAVQRQVPDTDIASDKVEKGFGYGFRGGLKFFF